MSLLNGYGYGPGGLGLGWVDPEEPESVADPARQYVASVTPLGTPEEWLDREERLRSPSGWHGRLEYEAMYRTPAAGSSVDAIRAAALANGVALLPSVRSRGAAPDPRVKDGTAVEAEMASMVADVDRRLLASWERPVELALWEMMEALWLGHVMAEVESDYVSGGPDDGMLAVTGLRTLPLTHYRFLLDPVGKVGRIGALSVDGGWREFAPEHFAWLTWDPRHGDPRGRSIFRSAHYHWRTLQDLWPELYKGWKQFGVPMLFGTTAPGARMQPEQNPDGTPKVGGRAMTAEHFFTLIMTRMVNGARIAGPNGSGIQVVESTKDSSVVSGAVSILEGQIIRAVLLQLRATVEARHGSRADSETGQDVMGTLIRHVRMWAEGFLRGVLRRQNARIFGDEIARRLTPLVDLGGTEHQDFAANASAVATLYQSAYFARSQLPFVDTFLGLPQRHPDDPRVGPNGLVSDEPAPDPEFPDAAQPQQPAEPAGAAA